MCLIAYIDGLMVKIGTGYYSCITVCAEKITVGSSKCMGDF